MKPLILCLLLSPLLLPAQDWPQWLGPQRNGVATSTTSIKTSFKEGLKPAWQLYLTDKEHRRRDGGSPIVVDGVVYIFHMREAQRDIMRWHLALPRKFLKRKQHDGLSEAGFTLIKSLTPAQKKWTDRQSYENWRDASDLVQSDKDYLDKLASNKETYRNNYLTAYQLDDGAQIWQVTWPGNLNKGWGGGEVHMTPTIVDGVIYLVESDGTTHARAITDGSSIWQSTEKVWGGYAGANSSPLVHKGIIYLSRETGQIALSAKDGSLLWASESIENFKTMDNSNAILPLADGKELLLVPTLTSGKKDFELFAMDVTNGAINWRLSKAAGRFMTPVVAGNRLVTVQSSATNKHAAGLYVYDLSQTPPTRVFKFPSQEQAKTVLGGQTCNTAVASNGRCWWGTTEGLFCLSLTDGKVLWQNKEHEISNYSTSILCGDVLISMIVDTGWGLFDANTGKTLHVQNIGQKKWHTIQSPAFSDGRLLFRSTNTGLVCFDLR